MSCETFEIPAEVVKTIQKVRKTKVRKAVSLPLGPAELVEPVKPAEPAVKKARKLAPALEGKVVRVFSDRWNHERQMRKRAGVDALSEVSGLLKSLYCLTQIKDSFPMTHLMIFEELDELKLKEYVKFCFAAAVEETAEV